MSEGYGFDALIEAFTIFKKYGDPKWPTHCEHDELTVCIDPSKVSEEDKARLDILGFKTSGEGDHFISFRFGSS